MAAPEVWGARCGGTPTRPGSGLFFFQAEDGIRALTVTGVQTCALPIFDDVHWADGASLELLAELRRTLQNLPIAMLLFARTEADPLELPVSLDLSIELAPLREIGRASCRERV